MVCVCVCGRHRAPCQKNNIFVIVVVSTKTSRGDTFAQIKQKKNGTNAQEHITIFFPAAMVR